MLLFKNAFIKSPCRFGLIIDINFLVLSYQPPSQWSMRKEVEDVSLLKNKKEFVIIGTSLCVRRTGK
jgi:hypothetical protein